MLDDNHCVELKLGELLLKQNLSEDIAAIPVLSLVLDSRKVSAGDVFIALPGLKVHGEVFIDAAIQSGAVAVLLESDKDGISHQDNVPIISISNLSGQLSLIASRYYQHPSKFMSIIGVTGTNGKTSCVQWVAELTAELDKSCGILGTLGYGVIEQGNSEFVFTSTGMTTPDALSTQYYLSELKRQGAKSVAMEISSHGLVQKRVGGVDIDVAVFTNLTQDHLDYHKTMQAYGKAKAMLFEFDSITSAVINYDDDFSLNLIERVDPSIDLYTFSLLVESVHYPNSKGHFSFTNIQMSHEGIQADLISPEGIFSVAVNLVGKFNLSNLLAVIAVLYSQGHSIKDIVRVAQRLNPVLGRMELIANKTGITVVVDYAHTPDALEKALKALGPWSSGKLWCVFGCGGERDKEKRPIMASIAEECADSVVITTDNARNEDPQAIFDDIKQGFSKENYSIISDRKKAIDSAIQQAKAGDVVLIAGKGHENYQLIGTEIFEFSDQQCARLCLREREREMLDND